MRTLLLSWVGALLLVLGLAAPAVAETRVFYDQAGDTRGQYADITRVRVDHGTGDLVTVKAFVGRLRVADISHIWLSTTTAEGPEYRVTVAAENPEAAILEKMDGNWWGPVSQVEDCADLEASVDGVGDPADDPDYVQAAVPRSCLGTPTWVRVAVRHKYTPDGPEFVDWAPSYQAFFAKVYND